MLRGEQYYYSESYNLAIEDFEKAVKVDPTLARAWFGWGQALFRSESIVDRVCKSQKIWKFSDLKDMCNQLKLHNIDRKIFPGKAKKSLEKMDKATCYGYDESKIDFEVGIIHEAMINVISSSTTFEKILSKYEGAYKKGNLDAGLYYCVAWIRLNYNVIVHSCGVREVDDVIDVLFSIYNAINKPMVCALLCYLYCMRRDYVRAERIFQETNDMAINELFYLEAVNSEGAPCSSSPA